jgi:hypothetical protein
MLLQSPHILWKELDFDSVPPAGRLLLTRALYRGSDRGYMGGLSPKSPQIITVSSASFLVLFSATIEESI